MRFEAGHVHYAEQYSPLDVFDSRCRVICAILLSVAIASVQTMPGLLAGSVVPLLLLFTGSVKELGKALLHVNFFSIFLWITLPLTMSGDSGLRLALLVTCKLNLISIVLMRMMVTLGMRRIDNVLADFHLPEKMRVLLLLTIRYTFLLAERVAVMARAIHLRAPLLRGRRLCSTFACMLGTTLIHSSDRAKRSMLAIQCRGGTTGFTQCCPTTWRFRDTLLCAFFALNIALIGVISLHPPF